MTSENDYSHLTQLGKKTPAPSCPEEANLEKVKNPYPQHDYVIRLTSPEFTSLCPLTGQPDFAHLVLDYIPQEWIVESKSFKLFLTSFRNHGAFHEACTLSIAQRMIETLEPKWLRISGYWYPRGGIPLDIFYQTGQPPEHVWIQEPTIETYRAR